MQAPDRAVRGPAPLPAAKGGLDWPL